ncbi:MAG: hypothetical protein ABJM06_12170 [Gilvibacter sp.]
MRLGYFLLCFAIFGQLKAQTNPRGVVGKTFALSDTIVISDQSINPAFFRLNDTQDNPIDPSEYTIDYSTSTLIISAQLQRRLDSVFVQYRPYPAFLTRRYSLLDSTVVVANSGALDRLYSLQEATKARETTPFDGLITNGSITRGVTVGNNQNAVVNSQLDLQITGKLSDKVSIRASIQDANIPTQEGGYSQNLDEFDQIFIELFSDRWNIRAGDINLINNQSHFANFTKKIQGISLGANFVGKDSSRTRMQVAGALVRGVFSRSTFTGQEGNQGPYKLVGPNGELFILIVSGSERVFVNGVQLARGENNDYVIDYNAGEIRFNPTYPITANMRIAVEYQYTDRNYTRFVGYGQGDYSNESFTIGAYAYSESDAKNQPLQQNLSEEQVAVLQNAGDDRSLMTAPSAVPDTFSENKILYRKETISGIEAFVFSDNPDDELFNVRFSFVGENQGNYVISNSNAISRIFEFIPPVDSVPQGSYEPVFPIIAPTLLQVGGVYGKYHPSQKTEIDFELSASRSDQNLFSDLDDNNNNGIAAHLQGNQFIVSDSTGNYLKGFGSVDYLQEEYQSIERLFNVEFNRDWNLFLPSGDQLFTIGGLEGKHLKWGRTRYEFQRLTYDDSYTGNRHLLNSALRYKKTQLNVRASLLQSESDSLRSDFNRLFLGASQSLNKAWIGAKIDIEDNEQRLQAQDSLSPISQRFKDYELYTGIGDSTGVYASVGYRYRVTDSVVNNVLARVNNSQTYYLKTTPINTPNSQLSVFANYRTLRFEDTDKEKEQTINGRIVYNQRLWNNAVLWTTTVESNAGVVATQEFTYVAVEAGQGIYTWNDYNDNGIQELEEFEVAQFQDEATFVRVLLPNRIFIKVNENAFSQSITLQPKQWVNSENSFKKLLSKFYNQTTYLIDRKIKREDNNLMLNPFRDGGDDQLGLRLNIKNTLFFNRGLNRYTTSYTFLSTANKTLLSTGLQENTLQSHQFNFLHKVGTSWLFNFKGTLSENESISQNFPSRNFALDNIAIQPKISYLWNKSLRLDLSYKFSNKDNTLGNEALEQQTLGALFSYSKLDAGSINAEFNYINNDFTGSPFSPVSYQILEGLSPGTNFTWSVLFQKKITKYLDANVSYFGRKSELSKTIHSGSVQLRAYF